MRNSSLLALTLLLILSVLSPSLAEERSIDEALNPAIKAYHEENYEDAQGLLVEYLESGSSEEPPSAAEAYFYLALIEEDADKLTSAEDFYKASLTAWPDYARSLTGLGTLLSMRGEYEQAQSMLERAVALDAESAISRANLGFVYLSLNLMNKAERQLRYAVELNPDMVFARVNLGFIYMETERYDKAIEQYRYALLVDPNNFEANANLANLLVAWTKDYGDAYLYYKKVLIAAPDDFIANQHVGNIFAIIGDYAEAERYLEKADRLNPGDPRTEQLLEYVRKRLSEAPPAGPVISQVILDGNVEEKELVLEAFGLKPGQPFSEQLVNDGVERIRNFFVDRPVSGVDVSYRTVEQFDGRAVSLEVEVVTGGTAEIASVELRGLINTPTDTVEPILSSHNIFAGADYNSTAVFTAIRELYDTGHFESVSRNLRSGDNEAQIHLIFLFTEKQ